MTMVRRLILAGVMVALVTSPAAAQLPVTPTFPLQKGPKELTPEERAKQKALDDAYQAALPKIKDKSGPADPWAGVRPEPSSPPSRRGSN
jgi:hypothetical protein